MDPQALKNARILIVDDQEANIDLLKRMLEHDGFTDVASTRRASIGAWYHAPRRGTGHWRTMTGAAVVIWMW